ARVASLVAEAIGGRAVVSPFGISAAVAARAIERAGWAGAPATGPRLASGELLATVAWYEDDGLPLGAAPTVRLASCADGFLLDGCKRSVPFGAEAGLVLVPSTMGMERVLVAVETGVDLASASTVGEATGRIE